MPTTSPRASKTDPPLMKPIDVASSANAGPVTPPLPEPHPHNLALIDQVHRQLSVGLQRFLRQHGFGSPIRRDILHPLYEMNEDWIGVRFECHDPIASVRDAAQTVRATC